MSSNNDNSRKTSFDSATFWQSYSPIETAPLADGPAPVRADDQTLNNQAVDDVVRTDLYTMIGNYLIKSQPKRFRGTISAWEDYQMTREELEDARRPPADLRAVAQAEHKCLEAFNALTAEATAAITELFR